MSQTSGRQAPMSEAIHSLILILGSVDENTQQHCLRVGSMAAQLARSYGLDEYQQGLAEFAGILHDLGKMGVPLEIIQHPGKLSDRQYELMKLHPVLSVQMLQPFRHIEFFAEIFPVIRAHHERFDGKGYPDALRGEQIPILARLLSVVDTVDAMAEDRPYRKGLSQEAIEKELIRVSGTQLEGSLVDLYLASYRFWARGPHAGFGFAKYLQYETRPSTEKTSRKSA